MSRTIVIAIVFLAAFGMQYVPAPDTMTSFAVGGIVGLVLGAILGIAFVYGEAEPPR